MLCVLCWLCGKRCGGVGVGAAGEWTTDRRQRRMIKWREVILIYLSIFRENETNNLCSHERGI